MADDFESIDLEYSEDDILYYIVDENDNEIGFALDENGFEVEYYYDGIDASAFEAADGTGILTTLKDDAAPEPVMAKVPAGSGESMELEFSVGDVAYYIVDENDNELGFALIEDGVEVEYYYDDDDFEDEEDEDADEGAGASAREPEAAEPEADPEPPGYLRKIASIAGHEGNKARKKAEVQIDKVRDKAEIGVDKATAAVESGTKKLKGKSEDIDLGITREGVAEATADLNTIAKEGAATAKELKEAYDDIMDSFGWLAPKKIRRR